MSELLSLPPYTGNHSQLNKKGKTCSWLARNDSFGTSTHRFSTFPFLGSFLLGSQLSCGHTGLTGTPSHHSQFFLVLSIGLLASEVMRIQE